VGGELDPEGQPIYRGTCRHLPKSESERRIANGRTLCAPHPMNEATSDLCRSAWGDVVIVRKDIGDQYHVAVVYRRSPAGITDVVRGCDLDAATHPRRPAAASPLRYTQYYHHPLIGDETGRKLSKSEAAKSLRSLRDEGMSPIDIRRVLGF